MIKRLNKNKKLTRTFLLAMIACVVLGGFGMALAAEGTPSNIAKKSSIYAEVTDPFWENNGYGTSALVDGVTGGTNYFSTEDYTTPDVTKELYFSFNDTYTISEIKFVSPSNRSIPKDFTICAWNGDSWVEIANETGVEVGSGAVYTKSGLNQTCTGLRIRATKLSVGSNASKYSMRFSEIEIMGVESNTKLANPTVHTMNVVQGTSADNIQFDCPNWAATDFPKTELVDGNTTDHKNFSTTANLNEDAEKEIYLTLDGTYQMNEVVLYPALQILNGTKQYVGGFPVDFTVSIWDGNEWQEVVRKTGTSVGAIGTADTSVKPVSLEFPMVDGNAIRINVTKQGVVEDGTKFALRLAEIKVNGVKLAKTDMETPDIVFEAKNIAKTADVDAATYVFDKTYTVNEVVINKADFPKAFEVSVWDGTSWQKVASKKSADFTNGGVYLTFDAVDCRAIRISSDSTIPALRVDANEIVIHGTDTSAFVNVPEPMANAAYNAVVEMECPDWAQATLGSAQLVDGKVTNFTTTAYATDAATTKTAKVTFASAYEVSKINLYPRLNGDGTYKTDGGFPAAFKVCVWDGEVWKEVKTVTEMATFSDKYPVLSLTLDTAELCNGVKIEVTTLGASDSADQPYVLQLAELEVLGQKSEEVLGKPDEEKEPEEEPYTGVNAALNGTVDMKVAAFATTSFPKENLVDGTSKFTTSEYAKSADTEESAMVIFKDGSYTIDKIVLSPRMQGGKVYGFPENFKVSVWNGTKWVEVAAKTGYTSDGNALELEITPTLCNAVKIELTKMGPSDNASVPYTFQLAELEAWGQKSTASLAKPSTGSTNTPVTQDGTNAALNGTVTMNVPKWAASFPGAKLVDGATTGDNNFATTEYVADAGTEESIIVAFKDGAYEIDNIKLYPRVKGTAYNGGFPVDFKISVWNGTKWVEVTKKTGVVKNTTDPVSLDIKATVCNALKIDVTKQGESENAGKYTLQLAEIQAFGEKSSKKLAAAPTSGSTTATGAGGTTTIDNDKNLALYRPVTASSDLSQYNAPVTKVNDGEINSYWASNDTKFVKGEAQWVEINLLNNYSVHTVVLGARQEALGFPYDFKIEVFYDGEWIEAYNVKGFEANEKAGYTAYEFKFPAVIGNKVRVSSDNFRKVGTSNSMVLSEVAVYGNSVTGNYVLPNENMITVGAVVTASTSMEDYDYYTKHLVDGNYTTGWSTVPTTDANSVQTVEVDMKGEVQLSEIQLKPSWGGHGFPIDFTISVLENGKWVDVYEATDYEKPEDEAIQRFQFETKKVTKFKITVTKMAEEAGLYVWKMNEIMAYPSHTGDEFDPNRVEEVRSSEKLTAAEVITPDDDNSNNGLFADVQLWKIVVGGILFLIAIAGCVTILIVSGKKNKNKQ